MDLQKFFAEIFMDLQKFFTELFMDLREFFVDLRSVCFMFYYFFVLDAFSVFVVSEIYDISIGSDFILSVLDSVDEVSSFLAPVAVCYRIRSLLLTYMILCIHHHILLFVTERTVFETANIEIALYVLVRNISDRPARYLPIFTEINIDTVPLHL